MKGGELNRAQFLCGRYHIKAKQFYTGRDKTTHDELGIS